MLIITALIVTASVAQEASTDSIQGTIQVSEGDDTGPFRSIVSGIGRLKVGENGLPMVFISARPRQIATVDGFKIEGLAARGRNSDDYRLFVGTDDEDYGGVLRQLP